MCLLTVNDRLAGEMSRLSPPLTLQDPASVLRNWLAGEALHSALVTLEP
jgi:hypothetical protein